MGQTIGTLYSNNSKFINVPGSYCTLKMVISCDCVNYEKVKPQLFFRLQLVLSSFHLTAGDVNYSKLEPLYLEHCQEIFASFEPIEQFVLGSGAEL